MAGSPERQHSGSESVIRLQACASRHPPPGVRAAFPAFCCLLVAVARLAGRWCFWWRCSWRWLVGPVLVLFSFLGGRRPEGRHFSRYLGRCSGTWFFASEASRPRDTWWCTSRRVRWLAIAGSWGDFWEESASFSTSANHPLSVPPTGSVHGGAFWCGQCARWQVLYVQTVSFSCLQFTTLRRPRRQLLRQQQSSVS